MSLLDSFPEIANLDDKTFDELVQEARSLIAQYTKEWTDHNVHDPGITFIELFAWLAEMQIYQLNQVTENNYKKFLKLVGLYPAGMQPTGVDITFQNITELKTILAGTQIVNKVGSEEIVFETEEAFTLVPANLKSIKTIFNSQTIDNTQANEKDSIFFFPFGEKAPLGAALLLGFDKPLPYKELHITFDLIEDDLCSVGSHGDEPVQVSPSAGVIWEYLYDGKWNALDVNKDTTLALTKSGRIVFAGPPSFDKKDDLYWMRCLIVKGSYEIVPKLNRILLNTIPVVQVETINENLGTGEGSPGQTVLLKKAPVIRESLKIQVKEDSGEWEDWYGVDDFALSGPDDPHCLFDPEKGEVTFGNGLNGRIPKTSEKIRASYKYTLAAKGNIPKWQKFQIKGYEGIVGDNLKEATGGKAAEAIEHAKARAKKDFRTPYRAITSEDYEYLALSTPGLRVARAKAIPNYNPDFPCILNFPGSVTVVIVPCVREGTVTSVPGEGFLQSIKDHLEMHRLVATDIYAIGPEYVKVSVMCQIHIKEKSSPSEVKKRIENAIESFLDPLRGGVDKKGWPFGRPVYLSEIYQVIDKAEGVDYATGVRIEAEGYPQKGDAVKIPPIALVFSGKHKVEIEE